MTMETQTPNVIKCSIILLVLMIGLLGNGLNIKIFSCENMKKISTFRYLLVMAFSDTILLILWSSFSILKYGFMIDIKNHSKLVFKLITFLCNYLSQLTCWIFMAANFNKARLMIKESKRNHQKSSSSILVNGSKCIPTISIHSKTIILICIILLMLNSHYLIFLNLNTWIDTNELKLVNKMTNQNRTFNKIFHSLIKTNENLTKKEIESIKNRLNNKILNQTDNDDHDQESSLKYYQIKNYEYEYFLNTFWTWIQLILITIMPLISNLTSTIIIIKKNQQFKNSKRIKFNKQFIHLFVVANTIILIDSIVYYAYIIYYRFKEYDMETYHVQFVPEIVLYTKNSTSFLIYLFTIRKYRRVIGNFFGKLGNKNGNKESEMTNYFNGIGSSSRKMTRLTNTESKMFDDLLSVDYLNKTKSRRRRSTMINFNLNSSSFVSNEIVENENEHVEMKMRKNRNNSFMRRESKILDIIWVGPDYFKNSSEFIEI